VERICTDEITKKDLTRRRKARQEKLIGECGNLGMAWKREIDSFVSLQWGIGILI
jgi:hypothetical protein